MKNLSKTSALFNCAICGYLIRDIINKIVLQVATLKNIHMCLNEKLLTSGCKINHYKKSESFKSKTSPVCNIAPSDYYSCSNVVWNGVILLLKAQHFFIVEMQVKASTPTVLEQQVSCCECKPEGEVKQQRWII